MVKRLFPGTNCKSNKRWLATRICLLFQGGILSANLVAHNLLELWFQEKGSKCPLQAPETQMVYRHTYRKNILPYKIRFLSNKGCNQEDSK